MTNRVDVTTWPDYEVLRDIRELRMVTTNARRAHTPGTRDEIRRRVEGLQRSEDTLTRNIL